MSSSWFLRLSTGIGNATGAVPRGSSALRIFNRVPNYLLPINPIYPALLEITGPRDHHIPLIL